MFAESVEDKKPIQCLQALEAKQRKVEDTGKTFSLPFSLFFFSVPLISFLFLVVKLTIVCPLLFLVWRNVRLCARG